MDPPRYTQPIYQQQMIQAEAEARAYSMPTPSGAGIGAGAFPGIVPPVMAAPTIITDEEPILTETEELGPGALVAAIPWLLKLWPYLAGGAAGLSVAGLLGGDDNGAMPGTALAPSPMPFPLVGPGLKEPPAYLVKKEWYNKRTNCQYYLFVIGRRKGIACYSRDNGNWTWWWCPKPIMIHTKNPRMKDVLRGAKAIKTILKRWDKSVSYFLPKPKRSGKRELSAQELIIAQAARRG